MKAMNSSHSISAGCGSDIEEAGRAKRKSIFSCCLSRGVLDKHAGVRLDDDDDGYGTTEKWALDFAKDQSETTYCETLRLV